LGNAHRDERHDPTSGTERLPSHVSSLTGAGEPVNTASGADNPRKIAALGTGAAYH
jgi:hypothetical protein